MKHLFILLSTMLITQTINATTKDDLVKFVTEAKEFALKNSNEKAFAEFNKKDGKFFRGELYIYVYEYGKDAETCTARAHGLYPERVGQLGCAAKDPDGKKVNVELMKAAKAGGGFVDFQWNNPLTNKVSKKIGYAMDLDGKHFLGSGFYPENAKK